MADMDGDYEGGDGCARGPQLSRRLATASRPDPITAPPFFPRDARRTLDGDSFFPAD